MNYLTLVASVTLVIACNPGKDNQDSDGSSSTGSSTGSSGSDSDSGATSSSGGATDPTTGPATTDSTTADSTTTESTDTEPSSTTIDEQPPACGMCFPGGCDASLCSPAVVTCEGYCDQTPPVLPDDATVECVLLALRDRTPGKLEWGDSENGGQFADQVTVWILDDGTAARTRFVAEDLCSSSGPGVLADLREPAYFDGCLAEPDPMTRFDCMRDAIEEVTFVCEPAADNCDI